MGGKLERKENKLKKVKEQYLDEVRNKPGVSRRQTRKGKKFNKTVQQVNELRREGPGKEDKKVKIKSKDGKSVEYVKGNRTKEEKGRSVTISEQKDGNYTKTVRKKKKDGTVTRKDKSISEKRAKRIMKRKNKTHSDAPGKMPDGFTMDRPAHKLGYIQQLGAGRVSPGKMGDMTAMKMMHGDAAAKYYDGAGMYMNGAPKYEGASKSYVGPMDAGHGGAEGHTHGNKFSGKVDFKVSKSEGAKLTDTKTSTSSKPSSTSSGGNTKVVDKGEDVFYNNLISSKKNMSEMKNLGIDPSNKKAVLDYGNKLHKSRQKSKSGGSSTSSRSSSTQSAPDNVQAIKREGTYELSKIIGQDNLSRHKQEMGFQRDSIGASNKRIFDLMKANPSRDKVTMAAIKQQGGYAGNEAANVGRKKANIPQVDLVNQFNNPYTNKPKVNRTKLSDESGLYVGQKRQKLKDPSSESGEVGFITDKKGNVVKQKYKRQGSLYSDINEVMGGSPKMPKGPMKFGMRK